MCAGLFFKFEFILKNAMFALELYNSLLTCAQEVTTKLDPSVAVLGAGSSGLGAAQMLKKCGFNV